MGRFWGGTVLVLLAAALTLGVGSASGTSAANPTRLVVEVIGGGEATGTGIDCGGGQTTCYATYSDSGTVTLTATAATNWTFSDWGTSDCTPTANTCDVTLDGADHRVQANFTTSGSSPTRTLSVSCTGTDGCTPLDTSVTPNVPAKGGDVTDSPALPGPNIDCGSSGMGKCTWEVIDQSTLTVVETPESGYFFSGWGGDCASTGTSKACTVQMTSDRNVSSNFSSSSATTTLTVTVVGNGTVTGGGITCGSGSTCTANEPTGSSVTLTAKPASGYTFIGWGATGGGTGDCTGTQDTCTVQMSALQMSATHSVTATFAVTYKLEVSVTGSGNVSGGSGVGAVNCGNGPSNCSGDEQQDKTVTLTASAAFGSSFLGWSGACTGVSTSCTITMNADKSVSANFRSTTFPLSVSVSGSGTVSGGGITCGAGASVCNADVTANSTVTLSATPSSGSTFTGWSGACSGSQATCTFSMTSAKSATATFSAGTPPPPPPSTFVLSVSASGKGTVTGGGINCGNGAGVCSANETSSSTVTLLATPASGAKFQGWSGACSGTLTTCSVSMTSAVSVSAVFTGTTGVTLTIKVGGKGTVAAPAGSCTSGGAGKTCAQHYSAGVAATLRASAAKGERFLGWSGACTGKKLTCIVALKAARSVIASFSGAVTVKAGAVLEAAGSPVVSRAGTHFLVTLHFRTSRGGVVHLEGLRAGRTVISLTFHVPVGTDMIGPFPAQLPGFFTFKVTLVAGGRSHTIQWQVCLGSCGAQAPKSAGAFLVTREQPTIKRAGAAWLITLHFRATKPSGAEVRVFRHGTLVADLDFAPGVGEASLGPFVLAAGSYSIRLTAIDAYGRVRHLTFSPILAR